MAKVSPDLLAGIVLDPVCGMRIEAKSAYATRHLDGVDVYLCSPECAEQFDAAPAKYLAALSDIEQAEPTDVVPSATTGVPEGLSGPVRIELPITGLTRSGGPTLEQALRAVPGVQRARVNTRGRLADLEYDPAQVSIGQLIQAVRQAGFDAGGASLRLKVHGLYCAECVARIEAALKATPGVLDATLNPATAEAKVDYLPGAVDLEGLTRAVEAAGPYRATQAAEAGESALDKESAEQEQEYGSLMRKWWFGLAVGIPTMILSYQYLIPGLRDLLPRGSSQLTLVWLLLGLGSLAVMAYSGW